MWIQVKQLALLHKQALGPRWWKIYTLREEVSTMLQKRKVIFQQMLVALTLLPSSPMSMTCLYSLHIHSILKTGPIMPFCVSSLVGLNANQRDPKRWELSYKHAGKCPKSVGPDDKRPSQIREASNWHDGHHMRREGPKAWLRPECSDQLLISVWMGFAGRMQCGLGRRPASLSPVALHHPPSDANSRHCLISSQQISPRHAIAINSGDCPECGLGESLPPRATRSHRCF